MMTPAQLKQYEFKSAGRNAYKADDVDSFFAEVLISYEKIYRENGELIKRVSLLADRLEKFKNDETDIKQAVLSAQKAADMITKDAEKFAAETKEEAENILAAAKGEAAIIKSDAEKQAIADSELLLSMARDKAEDIMKKAKEKAHGILIAANDSASDTVGAANRTITSESIHYDMLKKEVSEFRSSILAQYKAHIELISKLPELAVQEASKIEVATPPVAEVSVENLENKFEDNGVCEPEDSIIEFSDSDDDLIIENDVTESAEDDVENETEANVNSAEIPAVETTIVFDINEHAVNDIDNVVEDIPVSKKFTINTDGLSFDGFDDDGEIFEEDIAQNEASEDSVDFEETVDDTVDEIVEDTVEETIDDSAEEDVSEEPVDDSAEDSDNEESIDEDTIIHEETSSEEYDGAVTLEDDGPDVILSFDDDNLEEPVSFFDASVENETPSVEEDDAEETVVAEKTPEKIEYEDVYSNDDTEQFDDLIIAFDDPEEDTSSTPEPEYDAPVKSDESPESRRNRYAKMFGDSFADDNNDDDEEDSIASFFGSIQTITVDEPDTEVEKKHKKGFFRRKK